MKFKTLVMSFALPIIFISCNSNSSSDSQNESDDFVDEYQYIADSIDGEAVSHECAIAYTRIEELKWRWEDVRSPSMLAEGRSTWKTDINRIHSDIQAISGDEKLRLDSIYKDLLELYWKQCSEYSIPASGVISNLENCIRKVDKAKNAQELNRFRECRIGMLHNLDCIHLSIEESSSDIGKAKKLAETLKGKYEEKCAKFGLKP